MQELYCDLETYSETPINCGAHAYAETAEVMLFAYAFDDQPTKVWDASNGILHSADGTTTPWTRMPAELSAALADPDVMTVWHNGGGFDRIVLRHALGIDLPIERVHDTMVQALAHGLPGSLDMLGEIYKLAPDMAKLKTGRQLINLFCKPRPKNMKLRRATKQTNPEEWANFVEYAKQDIEAMRVLRRKIPMWNYEGFERQLWNLDQRVNNRGFYVDTELAKKAIEAVNKEQKRLAKATRKATGGAVEKTTQRDALLKHILEEHGVELPDLTKSTLERRINDPDLPEGVKELLRIRQQASTTSTSKYKALIKAASSDSRLRGTLQFCGASRTGRWAGRTFQPQNLPRPSMPQDAINEAIKDITAGIADLTHDNVMEAISSSVRGCICAPEGSKLCVSDLSNIEGRMAAWLAGEDWKLAAFSDYDNGKGHDLYKLAYAKSFGIKPEDVDKSQRQIGKVQELALQYEGGVGAFTTFADVYGIDLNAMADDAYDKIPQRIKNEANSFWGFANKNRRTLGLQEKTFVVCDALKRMWREAHPAISTYWKELEETAILAIANPGQTFQARKVKMVKQGAWLRVILPSGRSICYAGARVEDGKISYMGINQYSRKWQRIKTYGGKIFENITQAAARDVMGYNMPIIENEGYLIVLSVHDELLTETPNTPSYSHERLSELLATVPAWAAGIPLAAGGFEATRYRKD